MKQSNHESSPAAGTKIGNKANMKNVPRVPAPGMSPNETALSNKEKKGRKQ